MQNDGPVWMAEGSADVFGIRATDHWTEESYRDYSWERLQGIAPKLSILEREDAFKRYKRQVYTGGRLAVFRLVDENGLGSIIRFYERLGLGSSWKASFEQVFGISTKAFYAQIREMEHG